VLSPVNRRDRLALSSREELARRARSHPAIGARKPEDQDQTSADDEEPASQPASRKSDGKAMIVVACFVLGLMLLIALNMK